MDTYIDYFRSWLYAIALNNTDNKQYEEFVLDLISRIDSGGLERYIVHRVQEDLYANGKSEEDQPRVVVRGGDRCKSCPYFDPKCPTHSDVCKDMCGDK